MFSILVNYVILKYWNTYWVLNDAGIFIFPKNMKSKLCIQKSMTQFLIYATKQICVHFFTSRQVYAHQGCNEQPDVQLESFHWKHKSQSVHDETKKNKDKPEMLSSKQNRTAYHNKKSATLKKKKGYKNFQKVLLGDGVTWRQSQKKMSEPGVVTCTCSVSCLGSWARKISNLQELETILFDIARPHS